MRKFRKFSAMMLTVVMCAAAITGCGKEEVKKDDAKENTKEDVEVSLDLSNISDGDEASEKYVNVLSQVEKSLDEINSITLSGTGNVDITQEQEGQSMDMKGSGDVEFKITDNPLSAHAELGVEYEVAMGTQKLSGENSMEFYAEQDGNSIISYFTKDGENWEKEEKDAVDLDFSIDFSEYKKQISAIEKDEIQTVLSKLKEVKNLDKILKIEEDGDNYDLAFSFDKATLETLKEDFGLDNEDTEKLEQFDKLELSLNLAIDKDTFLPVGAKAQIKVSGDMDEGGKMDIKDASAELKLSYDKSDAIEVPKEVKEGAEEAGDYNIADIVDGDDIESEVNIDDEDYEDD